MKLNPLSIIREGIWLAKAARRASRMLHHLRDAEPW